MRLLGPLRDFRSLPIAVFAVALLIVLGGIAVVIQNEASYGRTQIAQTQGLADILSASVTAAVDFEDRVAAQEAVDAFRVNRPVRWIGVYDRRGSAIAGFDRGNGRFPQSISAIPPNNPRMVRIQSPVAQSGQQIGTVVIEAEREPASRRVMRYLLLSGLILLAALVVAGLGITQAQLRSANRELSARADALAQANVLLEDEMTQRAQAEEQLRQSQKMQALGQLTGGIAHDFNNLLTVIQGSADILARDQIGDERRIRFAQAIVQASSNAAALTSQLLAFARRQPLKPEKIDLNVLIGSMRDLLDRTLGERVTVRTELCAQGCPVEADVAQLQSAILNVASNARDAMADGGRLTITTGHTADRDGRTMITVTLSDTGSGMDAQTQERVFEPFFTTKSAGKGTGLGLSQVYGFASQSGGDVQVHSAVGKGTSVTISLPCAAASAGEPVKGESAKAEPRSSRILVVEDNEEVGKFAENLLSEMGHRVVLAMSAEEALEVVRSRDFDVVFSDVVMPGIGGLRLAELLEQEKPELPVILATGYSQEIAESGAGARRVILKPYRVATLNEALSEALNAGSRKDSDT